MSLNQSRSIVSLVLVGLVVVLSPLIAAIVIAMIQVDQLAQSSRTNVLAAGIAIEQSGALVEQLTEMQRSLGQFAVRGDIDFFDIYAERRGLFRNTLDELLELELEGFERNELAAIRAEEAALFAELVDENSEPVRDLAAGDASEKLSGLAARSRDVLAASDRLVAERANEAIESAASVQNTLLSLMAVAAPVTLLLIGLFTLMITRPMQALGNAIRSLGSGASGEPISVRGPKDIEALGRELDWLRRRIVSLEDQKSNFLRHISHELKTPLTTLREGSELLVESLDDDEHEEAEIARLMRENSLHLQRLIEDLLEFARTREPTSDLELSDDVDLCKLVRSSIATQSVAWESKDIKIDEVLEPTALRGDSGKLRVVVDNLLSNAIKFTPDDGRIRVSTQADDGDIVLDVKDTGPGIDPDEAELIFEPFQQGQVQNNSSVKGTGLGLAISREYAEAHGGSIAVVASEAGGHFRVTLPVGGP